MRSKARVSALIFGVGVFLALFWGFIHNRITKKPSAEGARDMQQPLNLIENTATTDGLVRRETVLMGTLFKFAIEAEPKTAEPALDEVIARLRKLESEISEWRQESDIHRLNSNAGINKVKMGDDAYALLGLSKRYCEETHQTFDVTIGPLWDRWPFRDPSLPIPSDDQLKQAKDLVNCAAIELDEKAHTAYLPKKGMSVNLGAIGKGYAAWIAGRTLEDRGIHRASIDAGGDIYLTKPKSSGAWPVEIRNPRWPDKIIERFTAANVGMATSGNSFRKIVRDGKSYTHIIDPRTGRPVDGVLSVTVLSADPVAADVYATAIFVMGAKEGMAWVEAHSHVQALIVDQNLEVHRSTGWAKAAGRMSAPEQQPGMLRLGRRPDTVIRGGRLTPTDPTQTVIHDFSPPEPLTRTTPEFIPPTRPARPLHHDAGDMVAIPAGAFVDADQHEATTGAYRIDRAEVSNRAYQAFLRDTRDAPHQYCHPGEPAAKDHTPRYWRDDWRPALLQHRPEGALSPFDMNTFRDPEKPVVGVDWWDAYAFVTWAGKRLPSQNEWIKAAGGKRGTRWPWGNHWDPKRANVGGEMNGEKDGYTYHAAKDIPGGASPFGSVHMAGNVAEWTQEGFVMGGSSRSTPSQAATNAGERKDPNYRGFDVGIRAAAGGAR